MAYAIRDIDLYAQARTEFKEDALCLGLKMGLVGDQDTFAIWQTYGLSYPTESAIDFIGRQLTTVMAADPRWVDYEYPAIYTNASSGNKIFRTSAMSRYPLWVANWSTPGKPPLTEPTKPAVWKGVDYYVWQDGVIDGTPYGIAGKVDHDVWGQLIPFPGDEPEPPPPSNEIEVTIKEPDGTKWAGKLQEQIE